MAETLGSAFDRRRNGLNLLRLVLAATVIIWHAFPLTGHDIRVGPIRQLTSEFGVDGFFAISGFLISGSWLGRPQLFPFLRARALRLLPGFYACLLFTALILAPVMVALTHGYLRLSDELAYLKANAFVWVNRYDIAGSPVGVPYPHVWNGSMWTLAWEGLCYLGIAALGLTRLLRRRTVVMLIFGFVWTIAAADVLGLIHHHMWLVSSAARFGLMFLAGVLVQLFKNRIPLSRGLLVAAAALVAGASALPDYRLVAAIPVAYVLIGIGAQIRAPRLQFRNDISYGVYVYAFPVQQSLALLGFWRLGVPIFALSAFAAVLPFAAGSWFGIERYAMRLKPGRGSTPPALMGTRTRDESTGRLECVTPEITQPYEQLRRPDAQEHLDSVPGTTG